MNGSGMDFLQSLTVSGLGMSVVFAALIALSLALMVFSKVFSSGAKRRGGVASAIPAAAGGAVRDRDGGEADEAFAVLGVAISEEVNAPIDSFRSKEVREIGPSD